MTNHLFVGCDGELFDTRAANWSSAAPLRANFKRHARDIRTAADFKATLRAGAFAWPGGYPLAFIASDGGLICFDCARKEARNIFESIANNSRDGWRVMACDICHAEESDDTCDHCSKIIAEVQS